MRSVKKAVVPAKTQPLTIQPADCDSQTLSNQRIVLTEKSKEYKEQWYSPTLSSHELWLMTATSGDCATVGKRSTRKENSNRLTTRCGRLLLQNKYRENEDRSFCRQRKTTEQTARCPRRRTYCKPARQGFGFSPSYKSCCNAYIPVFTPFKSSSRLRSPSTTAC